MSVLAALSRRATVQAPAMRIARRNLGDTVAGPQLANLPANLKSAMSFFTKSPTSYAEYKQQCVSLRLFAFVSVTGGCVLSLMLNPPKSSYWIRYSPGYWFSGIASLFTSSAPPIFLSGKQEHEADVPAIATELFSTRRLLSGGSSDDH
eukprot:TRINITY_DN85884_c0_g1_i1.p1 TRINITY_DN85884_c0_g1~~TRINITY_DN85884_c0_g1_i1.p1  ORF type:complete len:173 (+),score=34.03 TRINITY_DN85884_c0_g1_i1:74-520(+)